VETRTAYCRAASGHADYNEPEERCPALGPPLPGTQEILPTAGWPHRRGPVRPFRSRAVTGTASLLALRRYRHHDIHDRHEDHHQEEEDEKKIRKGSRAMETTRGLPLPLAVGLPDGSYGRLLASEGPADSNGMGRLGLDLD